MSTMRPTPLGNDVGGPAAPVILPMGLARNGSGKASDDVRANGQRRNQAVARFEFPAIVASERAPTRESPGAIWPKCESTEDMAAGVRLADAIVEHLSAEQPAVVGITSPSNGDGKTCVTTVLAPELAKRVDGGVIAVDADYRKADLTGLLSLAASRTPDNSPLVYPTDVPGLSVLPRPPGLEWQYLDADWIEQFREGWPLAILDLGSLENAETASVLRYCDGVCLVVRLGQTPRRMVREAGRVVRANGGRLWGSIVVG